MNSSSESPSMVRRQKSVVVYACSGCSDAGELADRVARTLARDGGVQMSCLAGIGGRVKSLMAKAKTADRILVIDGCPLSCAKHTLELAGLSGFAHLELQNLGLRKGSCPVDADNIATGVAAARQIILQTPANSPAHTPSEQIQTV